MSGTGHGRRYLSECVNVPAISFIHFSTLRLGATLLSAYTLAFQTHVYATFPPSFSQGFKALIASTFSLVNASCPPPWALPSEQIAQGSSPSRPDLPLWTVCDTLGLLDRYESLIASVCYEYIEAHVEETCMKKWDESMLTALREWMAERVVPWMVMPYARGARSGECFWQHWSSGEELTRLKRKKHVRCFRVSVQDSTITSARHSVIFGMSFVSPLIRPAAHHCP